VAAAAVAAAPAGEAASFTETSAGGSSGPWVQRTWPFPANWYPPTHGPVFGAVRPR
jgi:hypothetical protein